jgi:hypothetical protein
VLEWRSGIRPDPFYPRAGVSSGLRSTEATTTGLGPNSTQNTSLMGEDCPHLYVAPPPSIPDVGLNPTISPVTHWVKLSSHNHPCDPLETFTGSPSPCDPEMFSQVFPTFDSDTTCKRLALRGDEPPANLHATERRLDLPRQTCTITDDNGDTIFVNLLKWRSGIRPDPLYPRAGASSGLRSTGAHNNRPWA